MRGEKVNIPIIMRDRLLAAKLQGLRQDHTRGVCTADETEKLLRLYHFEKLDLSSVKQY
jgi:hypothetical protein